MDLTKLYQPFKKHSRISIDSRRIVGGELFFAIKGDRFDGNAYAAAALESGAAYAVVDDESVVQDERYILVDDALTALQDLGRHHRRQFDIPVVGITGSNGKTTTKELVAEVLRRKYRLHFTQGNFNNHIGVPLTLLAMPEDTEIAVIEMGANHQGEIDMLSRIAEPTHGLITNIGKAHLEGFGGIEGVKKGKSELYRFLAETDGLVFINRDEPFLEDLAAPCRRRRFYYQTKQVEGPFEVKLLQDQPTLAVQFADADATATANTQLVGLYNLGNIMTAVALGHYFEVPGHDIKAALESYVPENMRTQIMRRGTNLFLLDAYNANPTSMQGAIRAFRKMEAQRRILILGDMLELGEDAGYEHRAVLDLAAELGFDEVILVGSLFEPLAAAYGHRHFPDSAALRTWFDGAGYEQSHFLVKGSRSIRLERLLKEEQD